jgi:Tol biopolymer transport system component
VIEAHSPSPDGESIAFGMGVRGVYDIYRMPIRGGDLELIVSTGDHVFDPAWSPDGAEIAFDGHSTRPDGLGAVWVVSALGGTPIQVADFPGYDNKQDWSPDGLTIAFASSGPEGRGGQKIWTVSRAETGQPWGTPEQLTEDPCWWPDWAPDGTSLVCDSGVGLVRVSTSGTVLWRLELSPVMVTVDQPHFSLDGSKIYFLAEHQDGRRGIWSIPSDGGEATVVVAFDDPSLTVLSYLSLDAERFYLTIGEYESDIWVADLDW